MPPPEMKTFANKLRAIDRGYTLQGTLSGRAVPHPDVDSGYPSIEPILMHGGADMTVTRIMGERAAPAGHPDTLNSNLKIGLLIPSTNTTIETELWELILRNRSVLPGVGLHSVSVLTPDPAIRAPEESEKYGNDFRDNTISATEIALHADPQYLILGFSLEMVHGTLEALAIPDQVERQFGIGVAVWARAVTAALEKFGAKRVSVLTPFNEPGNRSTLQFFAELGFEVVNIVGLSCASTVDVAHIPEALMEQVIREELAVEGVDAVVQCGTGLSMSNISERLEPELGVPIIGINAALLWYALRENGYMEPLEGGGRLLREH
jgi:maleate isomerase